MILQIVYDKITHYSQGAFYKIKLVLLLVFMSLLFATPAYHYFKSISDWETDVLGNWSAVMKKAHNPLDELKEFAPESHAAKKVFRLTVPVIIKLTFSNPLRILIIQFLLGIFTLLLLYNFLLKTFENDAVAATLMLSGITFVYFGRSFYVDVYSWFDGWAYFFLVLTIVLKRWYFIFIAAIMASFTDERALIALSIALVAHQTLLNQKEGYSLKSMLSLNKNSLAILASILSYFLIRKYLESNYMQTPASNVSVDTLIAQIGFFGLGLWSFFEGYWLVILLFFAIAIYKKHYLLSMAYLAPIALMSVVSFMVYDITRSGAYMFFILFPMLIYIFRQVERSNLRAVLLFSSLISFIFPAYYIITDLKPYFLWQKPIFVGALGEIFKLMQ